MHVNIALNFGKLKIWSFHVYVKFNGSLISGTSDFQRDISNDIDFLIHVIGKDKGKVYSFSIFVTLFCVVPVKFLESGWCEAEYLFAVWYPSFLKL